MKYSHYAAIALLLAGCATPVRTTVDGYGEAPLSPSDSLFFDRDALPLAEKPVSDSCKDAARDLKLNVSEKSCATCKHVKVRSRLGNSLTVLESHGPSFGSSVGVFNGGTAFGLGIGTGNVSSRDQTERVIEIEISDHDKKPLRSIAARSFGKNNSVAAVAYEMCTAAFQDYPNNIKGKEYAIKPQ